MTDKYTVKENEQLEDIAKKFETTILDIINANQLKNFTLYPGQVLDIPTKETKHFTFYEIKDGDTLYSIANNLGVEAALLANINGLELYDYIYPGQLLLVPKSGVKFYITRDGDTLRKASAILETTTDQLVEDNDSIYLMAGQLLISVEK